MLRSRSLARTSLPTRLSEMAKRASNEPRPQGSGKRKLLGPRVRGARAFRAGAAIEALNVSARDSGFSGDFRDVEREAAIAEGDRVAGLETGWSGDLLAVEERSVLRGDVVEFTPQIGMDHNGTVSARHTLVANNDIVVGKSADAVHPDVQRENVRAVFEVEGESPSDSRDETRRSGERGGTKPLITENAHVTRDRLAPTSILERFARSAEHVPPGLAFQMQTVEPGI
jgi:hypothetical protein